jgi:hypothetical protein
MRHLFGLICVLALGVMGCGETTGTGGSGGFGGADFCEGVTCEDDENQCIGDGVCDPADGMCDYPPVADGMPCAGGACQAGQCALSGTVLPCTEQGIRNAIMAGGGPFTFDCDGPTTIVTEAEIVIGNDVLLDGGGELTLDGDGDHRVFSVPDAVTVELHGFTVIHGLALGEDGGGIANNGILTINDSVVSDNDTRVIYDDPGTGGAGGISTHGGSGGGIQNRGEMTIVDSTVSGNYAELGPGGIQNGGEMTIVDSTVSGNNATGGTSDSGQCGGIWNTSLGTLTVTDSTVSGNYMIAGRFSTGGIANGGAMTLTNSTVSGNYIVEGSAGGIGGVGGIWNYSTLTLANSTVSGNTAPWGGVFNSFTLNVANSLIQDACRPGEAISSGGHNIESPGDTCGFDHETDLVNITEGQLDLEPLQDNGGRTRTHALGAGSVAIDHIPELDCVDADGEALTIDQRGEPRPGGTMCDVGAFEVQQ